MKIKNVKKKMKQKEEITKKIELCLLCFERKEKEKVVTGKFNVKS